MWRPIVLWKAGSMAGASIAAVALTFTLAGEPEVGSVRPERPAVSAPDVAAPAWQLAALPAAVELVPPTLKAPPVATGEAQVSGAFVGIELRPAQVSVAAPVVEPAPWELETRLSPASLHLRLRFPATGVSRSCILRLV